MGRRKTSGLPTSVLRTVKDTLLETQEQGGGEWLDYSDGEEYAGRVDKRGLIVMEPVTGQGRRRHFRILVEELPPIKRN